jgi:hypothetical protein
LHLQMARSVRPRNWNLKMKGKIMLCTICLCLLRS